MTQHQCNFRVYYEDTDAGGVVYYANYLKYAERARTEMLRDKGIIQTELAETEGLYFVVRHAELDIQKPARLDDLLTVSTIIEDKKGASVTMLQHIFKEEMLLARIKVKIACITKSFKPARLPNGIF